MGMDNQLRLNACMPAPPPGEDREGVIELQYIYPWIITFQTLVGLGLPDLEWMR